MSTLTILGSGSIVSQPARSGLGEGRTLFEGMKSAHGFTLWLPASAI
jgi:hypothetical protein